MLDDDLESRFTKLEYEVDRLREDVASTRALAALADRDVAEIRTEMRGYRQVLNALRETQLEQGQQIKGLHHGLTEQGQQIKRLHHEVSELDRKMSAGFAMQADGMAQITALLTKIADPPA